MILRKLRYNTFFFQIILFSHCFTAVLRLRPNHGYISISQAGLRMMFQVLAAENQSSVQVRELMLYAMIAGASNRGKVDPEKTLTSDEVGLHVAAVLEDPVGFAGPILTLKTKDAVGKK